MFSFPATLRRKYEMQTTARNPLLSLCILTAARSPQPSSQSKAADRVLGPQEIAGCPYRAGKAEATQGGRGPPTPGGAVSPQVNGGQLWTSQGPSLFSGSTQEKQKGSCAA